GLANEFIAKSFAVRLDMARGRMREMDRQHEAPGPGDFTEQASARARRLVRVPIEDRRPAWLAALQSVVHKVADDDRVLPARADIDAAMARRMPWRRRQPECVVEREIVVDQQSLAGRDHRLAIKSPDIAAAAGAGLVALGRILPSGVFAFVKYVFGLWKGRHPAAVAQHRVPAGMIDVQMRAEHVVDVLEAQALRGEAVEPRLF